MKRLITGSVLFASMLILGLVGSMLLYSPKASAYYNENLDDWKVPSWVIRSRPGWNPYDGRCTDANGNNYSQGQAAYISTQEPDPSDLRFQGATVPYGTTVVPLNVVLSNQYCRDAGQYTVSKTWYRVGSVSVSGGASVSGINNGDIHGNGYPPFPYDLGNPPNWNSVGVNAIPFNIHLPVLAPGTYTFHVNLNNVSAINLFRNGVYQCVEGDDRRPGPPGPNRYPPPGSDPPASGYFDHCIEGGNGGDFVITVAPPPTGGLVITKYGPNNAPNANGHPSFPPGWADPNTVPGNNWVCINRRVSPNPYNGIGCGAGNPMNIFGSPNALEGGIYEVGLTAPPGWTIRTIRAGYFPGNYSNLGNANNVLVIVGGGGVAYVDVYYDPPPPTCGTISTNPNLPEVGQAFSAQFGFSGIPGPYTVRITNLGGMPAAGLAVNQTVGGTAPPNSATINNITVSAAGSYTVRYNVTLNGLTVNNCQGTITVGNKPYVKIFGNDIAAGGIFRDPVTKSCTAAQVNDLLNRRPAILAQDRIALPGQNVFGAGSQYAAFAVGENSQFNSGIMHSPRRAAQPESPATGMTVGNYNPDLSVGLLGGASPGAVGLDQDKVINYGGKGGQWRCIHNYYEEYKPTASPTPLAFPLVNVGATASGHYSSSIGDTVYMNGKSNLSGPHTIFIDDNLYIGPQFDTTPNLEYKNAFSGVSDIPSLYIVVKGNIYISAATNRIDGILIAQDDPSTAAVEGNIYTCSRLNAGEAIAVPPNDIHQQCGTQLIINGAFIANNVKFMRTANTLSQSIENENWGNSRAAEVFKGSEALYLGTPPPSFRINNSKDGFDSVTSLPPIL